MDMLYKYKEAFSLRDEIGTCPNIEVEIEVVMSLGYCPCVRWSNGFLLIVPFSLTSCNPPIYLLYSLQCLSTTQVDTK